MLSTDAEILEVWMERLEFDFGHVKFQMAIRYTNRNVMKSAK